MKAASTVRQQIIKEHEARRERMMVHAQMGKLQQRHFSRSSFAACRKPLTELKPTFIADLRDGLNENFVLIARTIVQPAKLSVFIE